MTAEARTSRLARATPEEEVVLDAALSERARRYAETLSNMGSGTRTWELILRMTAHDRHTYLNSLPEEQRLEVNPETQSYR